MLRKICITGANGFIGQSLCKSLSQLDSSVLAVVRDKNYFLNLKNVKYQEVKNYNEEDIWKNLLKNYDCVVHCAGKSSLSNNLKNYDKYNSENFINIEYLAEQAAEAGVKKIIFLSSIKVYGESTHINHNSIPNPNNLYGISKLDSEKVLKKISSKTGLEVVVVRLPLVYGTAVKGNIEKLIKVIKLGIPLPFSAIDNKRSMIGIDNLINFLILCIDHPIAAGKTFLVSDGEDLSTPDLINYIASIMKRKIYMFPVPFILLKFIFFTVSKQKEIKKLAKSLRVDISYTKKILNWTPSISIEEGIKRMIQGK